MNIFVLPGGTIKCNTADVQISVSSAALPQNILEIKYSAQFFSQLLFFFFGKLKLHEMILPTVASRCCQMTEKEKLKLNLDVLSLSEYV